MLIDTHCHLDFPELSDDLDYWKTELPRADIQALIIPGVRAADWQRMQRFGFIPGVHLAYGLHPSFCNEHQFSDLELLETRLSEPGVVAIGEIGLDRYGEQPDIALQWEFLTPQLELAERLKLPVLLHVRKAHEELILWLRRSSFSQGGVVHAFSGSHEQAKRYLEMGFKIGLGGALTYDGAHRLHRLVRQLNPGDYVLETDAPEMWPSFARDQPNTPLNLPRIASSIAQLREEPLETVLQDSTRAAHELFSRLKLRGENRGHKQS